MKNTLRRSGMDTAVVLFLLAVEFGRAGEFASVEGALMAITIAMLVALPYFLSSTPEIAFGRWLAGRGAVALVGIGLGVVLPESMRFMPMTLMIIAGIVSCYIQFYGLMRLRLAK